MDNPLHLQHQNHQDQEQQQESNQLQTETGTFTCEFCIEPTIHTKKSRNRELCSHPYCTDCMISYIKMKLEQNVARIPCPSPDCPHHLDVHFFQPLLPPQVFLKWCDVLCDPTLLGMDRCYCPYPDCSAFVVNECGGRLKKEKCPNCKRFFCFQCKLTWHSGFRCGVLRDENDVAFGVLAQERKWKRCPHCLHFVDRITGCNTVKCRCGRSFCYICGRNICRCYNSGDNTDNCILSWCDIVSSFIIIGIVIMVMAMLFEIDFGRFTK